MEQQTGRNRNEKINKTVSRVRENVELGPLIEVSFATQTIP